MVDFRTVTRDGKVISERSINQTDILKCPFVILVADHYREDGTCKCNDLTEQNRMIAEWGYSADDFRKVGLR